MTTDDVKAMCSRMELYYDEDHPDHISRNKLRSLSPPFMEFTVTDVPWPADGLRDYLDIKELNIWIYSDTDVCQKEATVTEILEEYDLRYRRTATYMDEVQMWAINYNMQV